MEGAPSPLVVLDTNVVLDWLVFDEPDVRPLIDAIVSGSAHWVATAAMRAEFEFVLARGFGGWLVDPLAAGSTWERHCVSMDAMAGAASLAYPRCRDPSDQMFIDLALVAGARWLVSRDRAVLALRKRLASLGVAVVTPGQWRPPASEE